MTTQKIIHQKKIFSLRMLALSNEYSQPRSWRSLPSILKVAERFIMFLLIIQDLLNQRAGKRLNETHESIQLYMRTHFECHSKDFKA